MVFIKILIINCPKVIWLSPVSRDLRVGLALRFFIAACKSFGEDAEFCAMGVVPGWKFWVVLGHIYEMTPNKN